jgi:hypothetical protein
LKYHCHIALMGRHLVDEPITNVEIAPSSRFQSSNSSQNCGLATPGWANQNPKLAIGDFKGDVLDRCHCSISP